MIPKEFTEILQSLRLNGCNSDDHPAINHGWNECIKAILDNPELEAFFQDFEAETFERGMEEGRERMIGRAELMREARDC